MKKKLFVQKILPAYICILGVLLGISWGGSRTITAIAENIAPTLGPIVIIDAGHGGVDGGATSVNGILESRINLEIAIKLNELLHLMGIHTRMIRTTDESIYTEGESIAAKKVSDLKNRIKIVNETENAILVSIHQNHFSESKYKGSQVFYGNSEDSMIFARKMQTAFVSTINQGSHRQIKKADGVYLLQHVKKTAILIECGFISNPEESKLLCSDVYQNKVCSVIASTISQYISQST